MKKAQSEGMPFGVVLKLATKAFVDGTLGIRLVSSESFNPATRKAVDEMIKDVKTGKNLSPRLRTAKEAVAYLRG